MGRYAAFIRHIVALGLSLWQGRLMALADTLAAAGMAHPGDLKPHHIFRRISTTEIQQFSELHQFLALGSLLKPEIEPAFYRENWKLARADQF